MKIFLVITLVLLITVLAYLRRKPKSVVGSHESTTAVISPEINLDEIAELSEIDFLNRFATIMVLYYKNQIPKETVVMCYNRRKSFLISNMQKAARDVAEANFKLTSKLSVLQVFLEQTYGQLMEVGGLLNRRKRRRFKRKVRVLERFLQVIQENGGARIAHVFYIIPAEETEDADNLESPFETAYMAVFAKENSELVKILNAINFDFMRFDSLMTSVATAKMEYIEVCKKRFEVQDICTRFLKFREESVELDAILPENI